MHKAILLRNLRFLEYPELNVCVEAEQSCFSTEIARKHRGQDYDCH